ncbi:hypothetical protein ACIBJE_02225 [Micromonospora sp. NPDC050187]|uniref:hypothetical protein n=1 Tax=Micromonospora sp. NPDC050187 TaxID=3364277 RepID=UPI0037B7D434
MTAPVLTDELRSRVESGAAWLDLHHPGWHDLIDVDVLDLDDCYSCVLGQVIGDFWKASITWGEALAMGFQARNGVHLVAEGEALTRAWTELIERRQT